MPFIVPILVAIGTGIITAAGAIGITIPITAALTVGTTAVLIGGSLLLSAVEAHVARSNMPSVASLASDVANHSVAVRQSMAPRVVGYGRFSIGGVITYMATTGNNAEILHLVVTLTGHQVDAVEQIYLGNYALTGIGPTGGSDTGMYSGKVSCEIKLGAPGEAAFSNLVSETASLSGAWTSAHRQDGCCSVHLRLVWDEKLFANGVPPLRFVVRGKLVYDPRNSTTAWSMNSALCINDHLQDTRFGMPSGPGEIATATVIAAANTCDEAVLLASSQYEARYSCNGFFDSSQTPGDILTGLLSSCAGELAWVGAQWNLFAGAWRSPAVSFGDDDLRGPLQLTARNGRRDLYNGVKGTFVSAADGYTATDFPAQVKASYVADDGGFPGCNDRGYWITLTAYALNDAVMSRGYAYVCKSAHTSSAGTEPGNGASWATVWAIVPDIAWKTVQYPYCNSATQAQRLARIDLETGRRMTVLAAPCKLQLYAAQPPDVVQFTHATYAWTNKTFKLTQSSLKFEDDGAIGFDMTLRETDSGVYAWSTALELPYLGTVSPAQVNTNGIAYPIIPPGSMPPVSIANVNSAIVGGVSPLSAADAGSNETISVAAFQMKVGGGVVSYNAGSISGCPYTTLEYVYCSDKFLSGGAVTYLVTTSSDAVVASPYNVYVGYITTGSAGGGGTSGGGGGGGLAMCCCIGMYLDEREQVQFAEAGIECDCHLGDGQVERHAIERVWPVAMRPCVEIRTANGCVWRGSVDTPVRLRDENEPVAAEFVGSGVMLTDNEGQIEWSAVTQVAPIGMKLVRMIFLGKREFAAGVSPRKRCFTHNGVSAK